MQKYEDNGSNTEQILPLSSGSGALAATRFSGSVTPTTTTAPSTPRPSTVRTASSKAKVQVHGQAKIQGQGQAKVQGQGQKRDAGDMTPNIETDPKAVQSAERYTKALLNQITGLRLQCTEIEQAMAGDQSWSWLTQLPQTQLYQKAKNAFETA